MTVSPTIALSKPIDGSSVLPRREKERDCHLKINHQSDKTLGCVMRQELSVLWRQKKARPAVLRRQVVSTTGNSKALSHARHAYRRQGKALHMHETRSPKDNTNEGTIRPCPYAESSRTTRDIATHRPRPSLLVSAHPPQSSRITRRATRQVNTRALATLTDRLEEPGARD